MQGRFPDQMKSAEVIPLFKGKEFDFITNYRPISLLLTVSKVLEKFIYKRVYKFLEKNKVIYASQYGFRHQRSCEQAIEELIGRLLHAKLENKESACLSLDLTKVFDTLNHSVLLKKVM